MGKASTVADTIRVAEIFKRHSILPEFSFVLGYPPHPEKDIDASLALMTTLRDLNRRTHFIPHVYTPLPDTGNYELATDNQFASPTTMEGWLEARWRDFGRMHHPQHALARGRAREVPARLRVVHRYSNRVWANKAPGTVGPIPFRCSKPRARSAGKRTSSATRTSCSSSGKWDARSPGWLTARFPCQVHAHPGNSMALASGAARQWPRPWPRRSPVAVCA